MGGIAGLDGAGGYGGAEQEEDSQASNWILRLLPKSSGLCDESRGIANMGPLRRSQSCSSFGADEFKGFKRTQELERSFCDSETCNSSKKPRSNLSVSLDSWSSLLSKCGNRAPTMLLPHKIIAGFDGPDSNATISSNRSEAESLSIFHGFDLSAGVLPYSSFQDQIEGGNAKIKVRKKNPEEDKKGLASLLTPILPPCIKNHESGSSSQTNKIDFIHNESDSVLAMPHAKISNEWLSRWSFPIANSSSSAASDNDHKPLFICSSSSTSSKSKSSNQERTTAPKHLRYVPSAAAMAIVGKSSLNIHSALPNASWSNSIAAWQSDDADCRVNK